MAATPPSRRHHDQSRKAVALVGATCAPEILQDRLFRNPKIDIVWDGASEVLRLPGALPGSGATCAPGFTSGPATASLSRSGTAGADLVRAAAARPRLRSDHAGFDGDGGSGVLPPATSGQNLPPGGDRRGAGCMAALRSEKFLAAQEDSSAARCPIRLQKRAGRGEGGSRKARNGDGLGQVAGFSRGCRGERYPCRRSAQSSQSAVSRQSARSRRASACRCFIATRGASS